MKQSEIKAAATRVAARRSRKPFTAANPAGHALAFFEWLQPKGVPFAEAGPALVILDQPLDQVATQRELTRIAGGLKSPFIIGGRAKIQGHLVNLSRDPISNDDWRHAWDTSANEVHRAGWSQGQVDRVWGSVFQIYDGARKKGDIGTMLRSAVRGKNISGEKLERGSVLMIPRSGEWPSLSLSHENLAQLLASIYGPGAVYYVSAQPRPGGKVELEMPKRKCTKPDKPYSDGYDDDDDDDLPGDEWKKGGEK